MNSDNLSAKATIRIRRAPLEVFSAFVDASAMSKFWFTRRDEGLQQGQSVKWFIGRSEDATSFDIRVKELSRPNRIVIEWENGGVFTTVTWSIESTDEGDTVLTIEETGFAGSTEAIVDSARCL